MVNMEHEYMLKIGITNEVLEKEERSAREEFRCKLDNKYSQKERI
jgi:hypothetical protein